MRRKAAMLEAVKLSRRIGACSVAQDVTVTTGARYAWHVFSSAEQLKDFDPLGQRVLEVVHFTRGTPSGVYVRSPATPTGWRHK